MKKNIVALLMVSALTVAMVTACGSDSEETSGKATEETTAEESSGARLHPMDMYHRRMR